eukprot:scaffold6070_cov199-Ochromonas_danica.AAC.1
MKDLLLYCDPMIFCPTIHSVVIVEERFRFRLKDCSLLESRLSSFFGHCSHLDAVRFEGVWLDHVDIRKTATTLDLILFDLLSNLLPENILKKLTIKINLTDDEMVFSKIDKFLSKHMKSLKELRVCVISNVMLHHFLKYLIKSRQELVALDLSSAFFIHELVNRDIPLFLQYLAIAGMPMEKLCLPYPDISDEVLISIARSCPKLQRLTVSEGEHLSTPSIIYYLCPNFKELRETENFHLEVDDKKNSVHLDIDVPQHQGFLEDCMECLCLVLQRGQYHQVGLTVSGFLDDDEWTIVKTKVGAKLTSLRAEMSEEVLIDLLMNLPRLQVLEVENYANNNKINDGSLLAIAEHGQNLIELTFHANSECNFTDDMISHMIRRCRKLE